MKKYIVLGVAAGWSERKGPDVFLKLADLLPEEYQIVMVGTDSRIDEQLKRKGIISIPSSANQHELAEIYTAADVFVNPTREENYPTVNMEALACGTPVITFNTGGSPEIIDQTCGMVVEMDDLTTLVSDIRDVVENKRLPEEACLEKAQSFDRCDRFHDYVSLYGV